MDLGGGADPTLLPSLPRSAEAHRPGPLPPGELSQRYTRGRADPPDSAMVGRPPGPVSVLGARSEPRHGDPEWSTSPTWSTSPIYPTLPPIFPPHLSISGFPGMYWFVLNSNVCIERSIHTQYILGMYCVCIWFVLGIEYKCMYWYVWYVLVCIDLYLHVFACIMY